MARVGTAALDLEKVIFIFSCYYRECAAGTLELWMLL